MWRLLWTFVFLLIQTVQLEKSIPSAPASMLSLCHFPFHNVSSICSAWRVPGDFFTAQTIFGFLHHLLEKLLQPDPFLNRLLRIKLLWSARGRRSSSCVGGPKMPYFIYAQINTGWWSLCIHCAACISHAIVAIFWQPAVPSWGRLLWAAMSGVLHSNNTSALLLLWISGEVMADVGKTTTQEIKWRLIRKVIAQASTS